MHCMRKPKNSGLFVIIDHGSRRLGLMFFHDQAFIGRQHPLRRRQVLDEQSLPGEACPCMSARAASSQDWYERTAM